MTKRQLTKTSKNELLELENKNKVHSVIMDINNNITDSKYSKFFSKIGCSDIIIIPTKNTVKLNPFKLKRTTLACPSQWKGRNEDFQEIYIRYRHGLLTITYSYNMPRDILDINCEVLRIYLNDEFDGYLSNCELRMILKQFDLVKCRFFYIRHFYHILLDFYLEKRYTFFRMLKKYG